jgi:predicted enzyme related to lactoylglutathione lyase
MISDMHHSRFSTVIIDCRTSDLGAAAEFWSKAFGRSIRRDDSNTTYIALEMHDDEPLCQLQQVSHESRVHLDIETDDIDAEAARLAELGARTIERHATWIVMEAPTGQRFCVGRPKTADFPANANRWE